MALTGSTNYNNALTSTIKEEWLFEFRNNTYDDASASTEYIRLATAEVTPGAVSNDKYHEFITNSPSIRESIDLSKSTASVGNISLTCANGTLDNHSSATLAAEIYGGTRRYINHEVVVHSRVGGYTEQIFQGRLKEVKINGVDTLSMTIAVHDPIKDISIPQYQSKAGNYFPVLYGSATPETSTVSSPDFITVSRVFPLEVDTLNNDKFNCLAHEAIADGRLHYPVKDQFDEFGFPIMCPLDDVQNASHDDYEGATNDTNKNVLFTDLDLHRSYKIRPQTVANPSSGSGVTISNPGNAYDDNASNDADFVCALNTDATVDNVYTITDLPKEEHVLQTLKFKYRYSLTGYSSSNGALTVKIGVAIQHNGTLGDYKYTTKTANQSAEDIEVNLLSTSDFSNAENKSPEAVNVQVSFVNDASDVGGDNNVATINFFDMFFTLASKIVDDNDTDELLLANSSAVTSVKKLYTGADGFDKSWSSGNIVDIISDMHRDILHRFVGITATPGNYSALTSARANWFCKHHINKPIEVKKLLEQVQYEGGFILRFKPADNSPQYIVLTTNPSVVHTISKDDITNMNISITPIESLVTKREIKYEINAINDKTFRTITCEDTTNEPRGDYNIATKENVKTDELQILRNKVGDANMGGTVEGGFANHYNAIEGNPKLIISTEIINPGSSGGSSYFYLMEVGDICAFSHTNQVIAPFGESFNGKKFMIVSLTRSVGSLKVTLREI